MFLYSIFWEFFATAIVVMPYLALSIVVLIGLWSCSLLSELSWPVSSESTLSKSVEILQARIQTMQAAHSKEPAAMQARHAAEATNLTEQHEKEVSLLKTALSKAVKRFPYFRRMIRMESVCRTVGFEDKQTAALIKGRTPEYGGELYSEEHDCKFPVERVTVQITPDPTDKRKLQPDTDKMQFKGRCRRRVGKFQQCQIRKSKDDKCRE